MNLVSWHCWFESMPTWPSLLSSSKQSDIPLSVLGHSIDSSYFFCDAQSERTHFYRLCVVELAVRIQRIENQTLPFLGWGCYENRLQLAHQLSYRQACKLWLVAAYKTSLVKRRTILAV